MDEESVLEFLTSLEAMDLPDRIEEVNARILEKIVQETDYVAVLFCEYRSHLQIYRLFQKLMCDNIIVISYKFGSVNA